MAEPHYQIRPMRRQEAGLAVEWAAREGWNPGLHDMDSFYQADPEGFLLGLLDGEPIACISVVKYGDDFGFLGFYIVVPPFRGQGYGLRLWQAGMARLAGRNVGLDGVVAQQDNYRKSGFVLACQNVRYEGRVAGGLSEPEGMVAFPAMPFEAFAAYDRDFFPAERGRFLRAWLAQSGSVALGIRRGQRLAGYGVIRPCRSGYKVGPLFADDAVQADRLLQALLAKATPGAPFYLDVPSVNAAAVALAERRGMQAVFNTARMYTGRPPELAVARMFGITSFELG
ncbi:GNAT family N-acetyltransferase [Zobellella sp. An-6]|uniref:GNAT family N-acetyltransferase n=1 Tax=Zobellella sp. An-6 TaxID=3400218 RepID=UPI0040414D01